MDILLSIIGMIAAILLILLVMVQPGKADMISGMGGLGGQMTNLLGVRQSRNILQNATMILLGSLVLVSILTNKLFVGQEGSGTERAPVSQGVEIPVTPSSAPTQAPQAQPAAQPVAPATPQGK
ncbi:MAG: preprotein translocase subunit SecG [Candidatus Kapabacteria bacterium]|nr:preprotein translocase subunit SecG [Candidatus Kapabacteria bacterium]